MIRRIAFCFLVLFVGCFVFSEEVVSVEFPIFEGFEESEVELYKPIVLNIVNEEILSSSTLLLASDSEQSFSYLKDTDNENIGNFIAPTIFLKTSLSKASVDSITLSAQIIDIEKNITKASTSISIDETLTPSILENKIRVIVNTLFEQMKVKKSNNTETSLDSDIKALALEIEKRDSTISDLDAQINSLSQSDLSSDEIKRESLRLESEKSKLLIKQDIDRQKLERARQDSERLLQEQELAKNRSSELNMTIEKQKKEYEQKALSLRNKKLENLSTYEQINIIEEKKQAILDIRSNTELQIHTMKNKIISDRDFDIGKVNDREWKKTELNANQEPIERAKKEREKEIDLIRTNAAAEIVKIEKEQRATTVDSENKIIKEINSNYKILAKSQVISSLDDSSLMRIGNYNGEEKGWIASVNIIFGSQIVHSVDILLPYKVITNKFPKYGTSEYDDTVEEYDSYFRMNVPVIYAEIDYTVNPMTTDSPSSYIINLKKIRIYRIDTGKKIYSKSFSKVSEIYKSLPVIDIRTKEQQEKNKLLENKKSEKLQKDLQRKEKNAKDIEEGTSFLSPVVHKGIDVGIRKDMGNPDIGIYYADIDFSMKPLFSGIAVNMLTSTELFESFDLTDIEVGYHIGYHSYGFGILFNPFISVEGGACFDCKTSLLPSYTNWYVKGSVGVHVISVVSLRYSCCYYNNEELSNSFYVGFALTGM